MTIGNLANSIAEQMDVLYDRFFFAAINMFANEVHVVGTLFEHGFAPVAQMAHRDQFYGGVHGPHGFGKTIMFFHIFFQRHVA